MIGGPPILSAPRHFAPPPRQPLLRRSQPAAPPARQAQPWRPGGAAPSQAAVPQARGVVQPQRPSAPAALASVGGLPQPSAAVRQQPEPVARAKFDEPPPPLPPGPSPGQRRSLALPAPEELGVRSAAPTPTALAVDWNAAHARLRRLGAVGLQTYQLPEGGHRVTVLLRTAQPERTRHVQATAGTEAEAVALAVASAEQAAPDLADRK